MSRDEREPDPMTTRPHPRSPLPPGTPSSSAGGGSRSPSGPAVLGPALALLLSGTAPLAAEDGTVVDFEQAMIGKPMTNWVEKNVTFTLAHPPTRSRAAGRVMFFPHLATGRKGILCAMADDPIPVRARFPEGASAVSLKLWGSTGCPASLEAFDEEGRLLDKASVPSVPGRKQPGDPIPFVELSVKAARIAYVQFGGPRTGEFLAADELRFVPLPHPNPQP